MQIILDFFGDQFSQCSAVLYAHILGKRRLQASDDLRIHATTAGFCNLSDPPAHAFRQTQNELFGSAAWRFCCHGVNILAKCYQLNSM